MNTLEILLQQIGLFVIYILAGMILVKTKVLNSETLDPISRFVIKMALPVMIFVNIIDGVERDTLFHSLSILVIAAVFYICTFIISLGMTKIFHLGGDQAGIYQAMFLFGNVGFMGIPIISTIYGGEYVLHVSIFMMTFNLSLFSYGVYLLSKDDAKNTAAAAVSEVQAAAPENSGSQKSTGFNVKKLLSPGILSAFLAHRHLSSRYPPPAACGQPVFYHWCHNNTACDDRHRFHLAGVEVFHGIYR